MIKREVPAQSGSRTRYPSGVACMAVALLLCLWMTRPCEGAGDVVEAARASVTSLGELDELADEQESQIATLHIEGVVWWSSESEGRVILKDETAVLQLELNLPCRMPSQGERLLLEGECVFMKTRDVIKLSGVPLVDGEGLHEPTERSGTIHLEAGRHPICVAWFNRTDRYALAVDYEGSEIARQGIPDAVLSHRQTDAVLGEVRFANGLRYRYCEGEWWRLLPNLDHIPAAKTGVARNFNIDVRERDNHVALQFRGFIEVPREGEYTFYVLSDDGSRLFIGAPSLEVRSLGKAALPSLQPGSPEEHSDGISEFEWAEIEGTVHSFQRLNGALELDLLTVSGLVNLKISAEYEDSYTLRPQNRIRATGVSRSIRALDGQWTRGEFFVQNWNTVEQQYISPEVWTDYPLMEIKELLALEISNIVDSVVHVRGDVTPVSGGALPMLTVGSDRIMLDGAESIGGIGRTVELLGRVGVAGTNVVLRGIHVRPVDDGDRAASDLPLLISTEEISQLSLEEAMRGYPVKVRGVITSPLEYDGAILQDASRGIYLELGQAIALKVGDYCEVEGTTGPFYFSPTIDVSQLRILGKGTLPVPVRPTWDQLINGSMHCNYVELEGVVTSSDDLTVTLLTRGGPINVRLNAIGPQLPPDALGATVRLQGSLLAEWDGESRRAVIGSISLEQHRVTIVHPSPIDLFAVPMKHVGDLLQFDPRAGALQRVKVGGVLIYQDEDISYLMDGEHGLRFNPVESITAQVGDRVEVVGFADMNGPSPQLREAIVRRLSHVGRPRPIVLPDGDLLREEYDAMLVQVEGVLLGSNTRSDGTVLEMQSGFRRFIVTVKDSAGLDNTLKPGGELELTGVYVGHGGDRVLGRPIDSFELLLSSGRDVRVLSNPPWWTLKRMLIVVGLLFGVLLTAFVWINQLHRKVEQRTQELGDQIQKRERAERQREIEEERARLAHDLHDDLGAGLTEANMLSVLVTSPSTTPEEKQRCADEMNDLLLRMVMSLDEIVWAENPRNDTVSSLAGYLSAHAQRLLELASVSCGLDVPDELPEQSLDPSFRRELFLAFKEAISNVVKHAKATKVWLRIEVQDDDLVIIVSDDGCGIAPGGQEPGADGLDNMRDRMRALGGSCDIRSVPGEGTAVRLQAPMLRVQT